MTMACNSARNPTSHSLQRIGAGFNTSAQATGLAGPSQPKIKHARAKNVFKLNPCQINRVYR